MVRTLLTLLAVGLVAAPIFAADQADAKALKVFAVTGEQAGKAVDYAAERKEGTTVVVFVSAEQWARPVARYLKVLDTELEKGVKGAEKATIVAVWLTDDAGQIKDYLPKAQGSLNFTKTALTVFEGAKAGPDGWNVDIASQVTAVVIRDGKEKARFSYKSTNEQDVPEVVKALSEK